MATAKERRALLKRLVEVNGQIGYAGGDEADKGLCLFDDMENNLGQVDEAVVQDLVKRGLLFRAERFIVGDYFPTEAGEAEARR